MVRRNPLLSSLLLSASVLATLWASAALFNHDRAPFVAACGVPILAGMLLGSRRLFWLHGTVATIVTALIWNTPSVWHTVIGVPAPSAGVSGALFASLVFLVFFTLGILMRSLAARGRGTRTV